MNRSLAEQLEAVRSELHTPEEWTDRTNPLTVMCERVIDPPPLLTLTPSYDPASCRFHVQCFHKTRHPKLVIPNRRETVGSIWLKDTLPS